LLCPLSSIMGHTLRTKDSHRALGGATMGGLGVGLIDVVLGR
jgi:hypothetical protein